ncbi:MAG: GatB/YqeY domain-containing protein [Acidobacteria bacterium]|nr:GatB/YqeY domain-containing protein [Acidobacteriota bacterium]
MSISDELKTAIADAMRKRDAPRLSALRMLKAALMNREVDKGRALGDEDEQQVVRSLVKQRRDSIEQFLGGGRRDLADKETAEIEVLERYLAPPLDPAELERLVGDAIVESGATSARDLGRAMKAAMAKLAGRSADGRVVSEIVRRKLGQ